MPRPGESAVPTCNTPPITGDEGPDASDLIGQWEVVSEGIDPGSVVIDIEHTKSGYWTIAHKNPISGQFGSKGWLPSQNRQTLEDGSFSMKVEYSGDSYEIQYRFKDGDADILECTVIVSGYPDIEATLIRLETPVVITEYETV